VLVGQAWPRRFAFALHDTAKCRRRPLWGSSGRSVAELDVEDVPALLGAVRRLPMAVAPVADRQTVGDTLSYFSAVRIASRLSRCSTPSSPPRRLRRRYVRIHPEQVHRIVHRFDLAQTPIVIAIGGADPLRAVIAHHVVDVDAP
jgi:hypothetical protein